MFTIDLFLRYAIFLVGVFLLLRVIYFRVSPHREALIGFLMFGNGVFIITYLLHSVEMSMGFAFGLFAVFSMLRYRTETISIRDMTYLFTTIVMSLMCAVSKVSYIELGSLTTAIVILSALGETYTFAPTITEKKITYDRVDKIHPEHYDELLVELRSRTGMNIVKVELGKIDYLSDSVQLTVFCAEENKKPEKR